MTYPDNFEQKIGFNEIRNLLRERCLSTLGKEQVEKMHFSSDADEVNEWLLQTREFRRLMEEVEDFPPAILLRCERVDCTHPRGEHPLRGRRAL